MSIFFFTVTRHRKTVNSVIDQLPVSRYIAHDGRETNSHRFEQRAGEPLLGDVSANTSLAFSSRAPLSCPPPNESEVRRLGLSPMASASSSGRIGRPDN